jgi:hypothetical protein
MTLEVLIEVHGRGGGSVGAGQSFYRRAHAGEKPGPLELQPQTTSSSFIWMKGWPGLTAVSSAMKFVRKFRH